MKKTTLLLAIVIAFQTSIFSQTTAVPNADFEQFLITFTTITGPLDGQILDSEAAAVTGSLNLGGAAPYNAINDFTGIEALTGITELIITYNTAVTSLDVSSNSSLTILNTEGCTSLGMITTGANTTLSEFRIPGVPATSIDVSGNSGLTLVDARFTGLTDLNLASNSLLVELQCRNSALTSLDMRNGNNANVTLFNSDFNGSLMCIYVDDAAAAYLAGWSKDASSTFVNNEAECNLLTVEGEDVVTFNMFPNPVNNTVFITSNMQKAELAIYDITGKVVLNESLQFGENAVQVNHLSSGVYLARLSSNGNTETKKLVIN